MQKREAKRIRLNVNNESEIDCAERAVTFPSSRPETVA
jgi:hypothetical protein